MKKLILLSSIAAGFIILACNKTTTLAPITVKPIFSATSKMTHAKDTVSSTGDTVWLTAQGAINDTARTYYITANLKTVDSVSKIPYAILYIKSIKVAFDTAGLANTGLFHWTSTLAFPIPSIATKTKIQTSAAFTYQLNLSSQMGNTTSTDSKYIYVK